MWIYFFIIVDVKILVTDSLTLKMIRFREYIVLKCSLLQSRREVQRLCVRARGESMTCLLGAGDL